MRSWRRRESARGSALLVSVLLVLLAFLLILAVTVRANETLHAVGRAQRRLLAFNAAEAGLAEAAQALLHGDGAETPGEVALGQATYETREEEGGWDEAGDRRRLVVTGRCRDQEVILAAVVVVVPGPRGPRRVRLVEWRQLPG